MQTLPPTLPPQRYKEELEKFLNFEVKEVLEGLPLQVHREKFLEILTNHCKLREEKVKEMKISEILPYIRWDPTYRNFKTLVELGLNNKVERGGE